MDHIRVCMENLMHDSISIESYTGNSPSGPLYGADTTEYWWLEEVSKNVTDTKGQEVVANLHGLGPYDSVVAVGDRVTWGSRIFRVVGVTPIRQFAMISHVEAFFQSIAA
jgi:hypothetical protein